MKNIITIRSVQQKVLGALSSPQGAPFSSALDTEGGVELIANIIYYIEKTALLVLSTKYDLSKIEGLPTDDELFNICVSAVKQIKENMKILTDILQKKKKFPFRKVIRETMLSIFECMDSLTFEEIAEVLLNDPDARKEMENKIFENHMSTLKQINQLVEEEEHSKQIIISDIELMKTIRSLIDEFIKENKNG